MWNLCVCEVYKFEKIVYNLYVCNGFSVHFILHIVCESFMSDLAAVEFFIGCSIVVSRFVLLV